MARESTHKPAQCPVCMEVLDLPATATVWPPHQKLGSATGPQTGVTGACSGAGYEVWWIGKTKVVPRPGGNDYMVVRDDQ